MGSKCYLCNCNPGPFFVWSSSRKFPRDKLIKILGNDRFTNKTILEGVQICYECFEKLKNDG